MSADDLFDPERLRGLWEGLQATVEATPPADAPVPDPAAALLTRLEAAMARELGHPAEQLAQLLKRARDLLAIRKDAASGAKAVAAAGEELLGLLDDIEDVFGALELAPAGEARS
mgnify:CR=1 FL=1